VQTVLDLDLDVFSQPIVRGYFQTGDRPLDKDHTCASADDVRHFLEMQCGLSTARKIHGKEFVTHDEAFSTWRRWIESGVLSTPFSVVHIDAHADMGHSDCGYIYLVSELLGFPVEQRRDPQRGSNAMNECNYLMFAAANEWIGHLTYVYPILTPWKANWAYGHDQRIQGEPSGGKPVDLMEMYFRDENVFTMEIQLKYCSKDVVKDWPRKPLKPVIRLEKSIPFALSDIPSFSFDKFTHMVVAQSPGYAPPAADRLLPIIREYFETS
jgi:hypothetical protein